MSRHRAHVVQPLKAKTVVNAIAASIFAGIVIGVIKPLGPLFAYILGV